MINGQALPSSVMDAYAEEGSSLLRSRRMVGDYLQTGQASLTSLVEQRSRLKARLCIRWLLLAASMVSYLISQRPVCVSGDLGKGSGSGSGYGQSYLKKLSALCRRCDSFPWAWLSFGGTAV